MIWPLDLGLMVLLVALAVLAIQVRDLLVAGVLLGVYSFGMALLFAQLGAVDVAFTEAVLGAGVTGVILLGTLFFLPRRSED
jgi:energy-converting hydrogenase B subunit D